jgi:hypothetical protein
MVILNGFIFAVQASPLQSNMPNKEERERVNPYQSTTTLKPATEPQFNNKEKLSPLPRRDQFPFSKLQPIKLSSPETRKKALEFLTNIPNPEK